MSDGYLLDLDIEGSGLVKPLEIGTKIKDYEIREILGQGGFGIVYLAWDEKLQVQRAVKEFLPQNLAGRSMGLQVSCILPKKKEIYSNGINKFLSEAQLIARINHPNIVKVVQCFEENGTAYIVMEYVLGKTLESLIKEDHRPSPDLIKKWLGSLLEGLSLLHSTGLVHRDIKPGNIIITAANQPILIDFGSTRPNVDGDEIQDAIISEPYSPMEQYAKVGEVKQGAFGDVYALGQTFYELAMSKKPISAPNRSQGVKQAYAIDLHVKGYGRAWLEALDKAINVHWQERWANAKEWSDYLVLKQEKANRSSSRWPFIVLIVIVICGIGMWFGYKALDESKLKSEDGAKSEIKSDSKAQKREGMVLLPASQARLEKNVIDVPSFWLDAKEVSRRDFSKSMGGDTSDCPSCSKGNVTFSQALEYCTKLGKRLPSEDEFVVAMQFSTETKDPFAISINGKKPGLPSSKPQSSLGLYDIIGNVAEWTGEPSKGYGDSVARLGLHEIRGGASYDKLEDAQARFNPKDLGDPNPDAYKNDGIGFRCAANP